MSHKFEIGNIVVLNSGGPNMTVQQLTDGQKADCVWFDENNDPHDKYFVIDTLKLAGT